MRIKEPPERHVMFLYLWAAGFGGIPLLMLPAFLLSGTGFNGEPSSRGGSSLLPALFLLLFPAIAGVVLSFTLRRQARAGFRLEPDGVHGAHDAEDMVIPWGEVRELAWREVGPTTSIEVNGRPLPSGPAVHAVLHDGRAVRLMQRVASTYRWQSRIEAQLVAAAAAGVLPVPLRPLGEGAPPPQPGHPPAEQRAGGISDQELDRMLHAGEDQEADDAPSEDGPGWPTGV